MKIKDFSFQILSVQKDRNTGTGFVLIGIETKDSLRSLLAVAKVRGIFVFDLLWLNLRRRIKPAN